MIRRTVSCPCFVSKVKAPNEQVLQMRLVSLSRQSIQFELFPQSGYTMKDICRFFDVGLHVSIMRERLKRDTIQRVYSSAHFGHILDGVELQQKFIVWGRGGISKPNEQTRSCIITVPITVPFTTEICIILWGVFSKKVYLTYQWSSVYEMPAPVRMFDICNVNYIGGAGVVYRIMLETAESTELTDISLYISRFEPGCGEWEAHRAERIVHWSMQYVSGMVQGLRYGYRYRFLFVRETLMHRCEETFEFDLMPPVTTFHCCICGKLLMFNDGMVAIPIDCKHPLHVTCAETSKYCLICNTRTSGCSIVSLSPFHR